MSDINSVIPTFNVMDRALKMQGQWRWGRRKTPAAPEMRFPGPPPSPKLIDGPIRTPSVPLIYNNAPKEPTIKQIVERERFLPDVGSYVRYVDSDGWDDSKKLLDTVWRVDAHVNGCEKGILIKCAGVNPGCDDVISPHRFEKWEPRIGDYIICDDRAWWLGKQYVQEACFWVRNCERRSRLICGIPCSDNYPEMRPAIGVKPHPVTAGFTVVNAKCGFKGKIDFYRTIGGSGRFDELEGFTYDTNVNPAHYKLIPYLGVRPFPKYGDEMDAIDAFVRKLVERGDLEACISHG